MLNNPGKALHESTHELLRILGIRPDKSLGQNFLISEQIRSRIVEMVRADKQKSIIEIGGGLGALSFPIARSGAEFYVYEIDRILKNFLSENLAKISDSVSVRGDFLREYPPCELEDRRFKVIGNIPYQITSPVLERVYASDFLPCEVILMVQYEVAKRIDAVPGIKDRGRLTIWCDYHASVEESFNVTSDAFFPKPNIGSTVIRLVTRNSFPFSNTGKIAFFKMVKLCFLMKRKTLVNNLMGLYGEHGKKQLESMLESIGLNPRIRAEGLSTADFIKIFKLLNPDHAD